VEQLSKRCDLPANPAWLNSLLKNSVEPSLSQGTTLVVPIKPLNWAAFRP